MRLIDYLWLRPTLSRFASRLLNALPTEQREGWFYDPEQGSLSHPSGNVLTLQNMFMEYSASGVLGRGVLIRKYADLAMSQSMEMPALWTSAMKNVIPVVRSEYVECTLAIRARLEGTPLGPVVLPLAGDLRIRLVYDFGNFVSYIDREQLLTWGKSAEQVLQHAIANLGRLQTPTWMDSTQGFLRLDSPMSYAESMFQLDSVVATLPFAADAVLMPCNRGILLAADSRSDMAVMAMLREAMRCAREAPWPISGVLLRRGADGWEQAAPPAGADRLSHGLGQMHMADNYAAQKDSLDALHDKNLREVFVATFALRGDPEAIESYCVWTENVPTLLPVADSVALVPEEEDAPLLRVTWTDLVEACGARLEATDEYPTRFLVTSFPDQEQWQAMGPRAIAN